MKSKQKREPVKKSVNSKNTDPGITKADMDRLARRWIEILFEQIQDSKNCELTVAIPGKSLDNKYRV
mgnify:CR=1 FL=1